MNLRAPCAFPLVVAVALWVCAAPASATVLTGPEGGLLTETLKAEAEGSVQLHSPLVSATCSKSTIEVKVKEQGESVTASGPVSTLDFSECGSSTFTVLKAGSLELHYTSGDKGTVTSSGAEIAVDTPLGITCIYSTTSTDLGTLTGSESTEGNATIDGSASLPRTGGSAFCGSSGGLTGSYVVTTPSTLSLDAAAPDVEGHFVTAGISKLDHVGTEPAPDKLEWTVDGLEGGVVCDGSEWKTARGGETTFEVFFRLNFSKCRTTNSANNFEIKTNECSIFLYPAKNTNEKTEQTMSLYCRDKKTVEIIDPDCTIKIPSQKNLKGMTFTKITLNGKDAVTIDFNVGLKKIQTSGACGEAEREGLLEGSLVVEAFVINTETRVDLTVT